MLLDFRQLIQHYGAKISGVIHIGAHYGEEHSLYEEADIKNIVYFEPLKKNFEVLQKNLYGKNAKLFNVALGSEEKDVEMFVESANNGQSSSILEPHLHLRQYPQIVFNEKEVVKMRRLDNVDVGGVFNLINIDVQGYELEVFKGAHNTLKNIDFIISEVNRGPVYKGCAIVDQLDDYLSNFGFSRRETNWAGVTWGDAFYVKE